MRSYEQLRQEVYRRGKEKKMKKQMLLRTAAAMSAMLALCVGLLLVGNLNRPNAEANFAGASPAPEMENGSDGGQKTESDFSMESLYASLGIIVKVDGQFDGAPVDGRVGKLDLINITEIVNLIYSIREQDSGAQMGGQLMDRYEDSWLTVTFLNELDEQISYELTSGKMKELATGKTYVVTLEQWEQLEKWLIKTKMIPKPEDPTIPQKEK